MIIKRQRNLENQDMERDTAFAGTGFLAAGKSAVAAALCRCTP
jgi:hypothetical protein